MGDEIFAFQDADRATNGRIEGTDKIGITYGFINVTNYAAEPSSSSQAWRHEVAE